MSKNLYYVLLFLFLDETKEACKKEHDKTLLLSKICDGAFILDGKDAHYIIYLEMKSGFKDVKNKAILQIPPSYLKLNALLKPFSSYDKSKYKEFGLIVSYPSKLPVSASAGNAKVLASKVAAVKKDRKDLVCEKYNRELRDKGRAEFHGSDFGMDKLKNLHPEMTFKRLPVIHHAVPDECVNATVDLDSIISAL